jgi:hypothetical protein
MSHPSLYRPIAPTWQVFPFPQRQGQILMPLHRPVCAYRFIKEQATHDLKAGAEKRQKVGRYPNRGRNFPDLRQPQQISGAIGLAITFGARQIAPR